MRVLLALIVLLCAPAAASAAGPPITVKAPDPCEVGSCTAELTYAAAPGEAAQVEVDWDHAGPAADAFAPDSVAACDELVCAATSPPYATAGVKRIAVRITSLGVTAYASRQIRVHEPEADPEAAAAAACAKARSGESCQPGGGRRTPGGGEKVSHKGWPAITGIFWMVKANHDARLTGAELNDELLGHHGDDRIAGGDGRDVIWGDWDPKNNTTRQRDVLAGDGGNDWIYSSHGRNTITGGAGKDYVWAYYGHGTIDCGPGKGDTARVRMDTRYRVRNCERIKNFCGHGSKPGGGCYKPGERPQKRRARR